MKYYIFSTIFRYGEHEYTAQDILVCHEGDNPIERLYSIWYANMFGDDTERRDDGDRAVFWRDDGCACCWLYGEPREISKSDFDVLRKYLSVIEAPIKEEKVILT